ncbi:hypothetical protein TNCT_434101 [Trichonephila clavata]|uniref:Uncharacterized protein n=1 Tax=Trichonephila clavata TaxID=2740835 RepID=A0A8X6FWL9_TRICU|nr:hypothetical protein TNCT_434101 [Trichonephila clavata]
MTDSPGSNRQLRHRSQSTCQMRVSTFVRDSPGSPSITHDSLRLHCLHPMLVFTGAISQTAKPTKVTFYSNYIKRLFFFL